MNDGKMSKNQLFFEKEGVQKKASESDMNSSSLKSDRFIYKTRLMLSKQIKAVGKLNCLLEHEVT